MKFTIPLNPVTKKNSQRIKIFGKQTRILPSAIFEQYQRDSGWYLNGKKAPTGLLNIQAIYYRANKKTVDITNLHSALHDVLVHYGVIPDDSYKFVGGTDGSRICFDANNPRTEVIITLMQDNNLSSVVDEV